VDVRTTLKRLDVMTFQRYIADMAVQTKRSTIYLDPDLYRAVRLKSADTNRSISDIVNESLRLSLAEDEEDLRAFEEHSKGPLMTYEQLLTRLKADGKI
jgi:hypothetical protein